MKSFFNIPTVLWGLGIIIGNVIFATISYVPAIIIFNVLFLIFGIIGFINKRKEL